MKKSIKKNLRKIFIFLFIIALAVFLVLTLFHKNTKTSSEIILSINKSNEINPFEKYTSSAVQPQTFYISGHSEEPAFTKEVTVNPFTVKEGQNQSFSIWAKDSKGISKVIGTISTDKGNEILKLSLVEGTAKEGRWESAWTAKNIGNSLSYNTNFRAINADGRATNLTLFWYGVK